MIRRRIPAQSCAPSAAQRALAYVATGSLPPFPTMAVLGFTTSTAASLALGLLIGWGIAP
jgi:hypothetical protein